MFKKYALFPLLIALVSRAPALDLHKSITQYAHRIWGQEEGLFQPTIYSVLQTGDGFIWLGTQDSLIRFDGVHFREFADGASVLHRTLVRSLAEDKGRNLWAGTLGSGIVRISPTGAVKQFSVRDGLPSDTVFGLAIAHDGTVWACTNEGLVQISGDRIKVFRTVPGLPSGRVRTTCEAKDGTRWIAGLDGGLARWTGSLSRSFSSAAIAPGQSVTALACTSDGNVWVGTVAGLVRIRGSESKAYMVRDGLPDNEVLALTEGPEGTLWIGTNDGVSRLHAGEINVYRTRDGLSHSQVLSLFMDREGTLWAGTKNGLDQFTDGKITPYTTSEGLPSNNVGPVIEDAQHRFWIGTLGDGLTSFDGRRFRTLTVKDGLTDNTVLSLALDRSGDLWVGTKAGINRVRDGRIVAAYTAKDGLPRGEIMSLFVDRAGTLWAGTGRGLRRLRGNAFVSESVPGAPDEEGVLAIDEDRSGPLFAGLRNSGLLLFRNGSLSHSLLDTAHPIDCFFLDDAHGSIWMGTLGSGLLRWKDNAISHVYVKDGLYDNRIYDIEADDRSNLWLASSKGVFRLNRGELEDFADGRRRSVTSIPFSTGQLRFECRSGVQPAACRTSDGRLWFSTTNGLVALDPDHLRNDSVPPPVSVTAMIVDGKRLPTSAQPHLGPRETNNVEIRYAGLSFISPEKVTFRYRLSPYEKSWVDASTRREAFYTNLPPGSFTFSVQARNADGIWSTQPASLRFTVDPKLYQRRWFWPALALLSGLLVLAGFRIRIRRLRHRFQLVLTERSRIARELHDTLLQGLSGITMQLQALWTRLPASPERSSLGEIIKDAGRCSAEARQSLWGLRTGESGSLEFSDKLADLAEQAVAGNRVALNLQIVPVSLREAPDAEYQLLRIAREAISNSLKHSEARELQVQLRCENSVLELTVADDGLGFADVWDRARGHFGLAGMRERAEEIGADLAIQSRPGLGTRLSVTLPLSSKVQISESNRQMLDLHQTQ